MNDDYTRNSDSEPAAPMGRVLPHSVEAEEYLLSCIMLDGQDVLGRCLLAKIEPDSFYVTAHGVIYAAAIRLYVANKPIDIATIAEELKTSHEIDTIGGYPFLVQVSSRIPTTAQAGYFIQKVMELSMLRAVIQAGTAVVEDAYAYTGDIDEFIAKTEERIFGATREKLPTPVKNWSTVLEEAEKQAEDIIAGRDDGLLSLGLNDLDTVFAKGRRGELIVVAARPSVGKSSLMRAMAKRAARDGLTVQVNSLEVPARDIALQMASSDSGISLRALSRAHATDKEAFRTALRALKLPKFHVYDNDYTLAKICARARALKPDVIFIDYLGLIHDCNPGPGETKAQAVGRVTKALKRLALELNCVVVLLAQINRASVSDGNREPRLDDLRDSGDIEQDADRVIFLHLPSSDPLLGTPQKSTDDVNDVPRFFVNVIQAKGRNVGTGIVSTYFKRATATFMQVDRRAA